MLTRILPWEQKGTWAIAETQFICMSRNFWIDAFSLNPLIDSVIPRAREDPREDGREAAVNLSSAGSPVPIGVAVTSRKPVFRR